MAVASRRIIAAISLGGFMVSAVTGLVFSVPPIVVLLRSLAVALVMGAISGIVVVIFERVWSR